MSPGGGFLTERREGRARVGMMRDHRTETSLRAPESKPRLFQSLQEERHPGEQFWTFSNHKCKIIYVRCLNHYVCGHVLQLSWGTDAEGRTVTPSSSSEEGWHSQGSAIGKKKRHLDPAPLPGPSTKGQFNRAQSS